MQPRQVIAILAWSLLLLAAPAAAEGPAGGEMTIRDTFAFNQSFWRNLHHTLYAQATHETCGERRRCRVEIYPEDQAALERLAPESRVSWREAVSFYAASLAHRSLLFDEEMVSLGQALSDSGAPDGSRPPDISPELRATLERVAPIYRQHLWPHHQQLNRAWLDEVRMHLERDGERLRARVATVLGEQWPSQPIAVDLVAYAHRAGAYTSIRPTRIAIATGNRGNQGLAALEVLMHESAHGMIGRIRERIEAIAASELDRPGAGGAAIRPDLWHEVLFYLVGRIVAEADDEYIPYADRHGLWDLAWPGPDRQLLERHFEPYLAGGATLDSALSGLIRDLASSAAPAVAEGR